VNSSVIVTVTATNNGQPVPNGTAVEFETSAGTFDTTSDVKAIVKTTTNGVATVALTANQSGPIRVRATVNNISRTVDVTFRDTPIVTPPASTTPTITSVSPSVGRPAGGQAIRITGTNFKTPLRVLFSTGAGSTPVEAFVTAATDTTIDVLTPAFNVGAGQQFISDVIVLTEAGTVREQRATSSGAFTFRNETLTPRISTATPNSGPVTGGTRITIIGDGFQAPVQVLFGSAEARVISVNFSQIIVESPAGRDTAPNGSGAVTGPVDITVKNINSATSVSMTAGFRYINAAQITAVGPTEGPATGGTRVTIEGVGFVAPVAVVIGGVAAQPVSVSGTKVIAITSGVDVEGCADQTGETSVTNIANGDQATGPDFIYRVPKPSIVNVSPSVVTAGGNVTVTVANATPGAVRIKLGSRSVFPTGVTFNGDGTASYQVPVPTNYTFPQLTCGSGGTRLGPLDVDVVYEHVSTGCTDTASQALTVNPTDPSCVLPPPAEVTQLAPVSPACADAGSVDDVDPATGTATITFRNDGGQTLLISRGAIVGANPGDFTISPSSQAIEPGQSGSFTVTFNPSATGARSANVTFGTNDPDEGSINVCLQGNGT
jgi:hypothetical protein